MNPYEAPVTATSARLQYTGIRAATACVGILSAVVICIYRMAAAGQYSPGTWEFFDWLVFLIPPLYLLIAWLIAVAAGQKPGWLYVIMLFPLRSAAILLWYVALELLLIRSNSFFWGWPTIDLVLFQIATIPILVFTVLCVLQRRTGKQEFALPVPDRDEPLSP